MPTAAKVAARTACSLDQLPPRLVEAAGRAEGRRAALKARREALYDQHREVVMGCAATLAHSVHLDDLTHAVSAEIAKVADKTDAQRRRDRVKAAALALIARTVLTTDGLGPAWRTANADAFAEWTAEGHAEASAAPAGGGPADPRTVAAAMPAAVGGVASALAWRTGTDWTDQQLSGLAGDIADQASHVADPAVLQPILHDALRRADGVAFYLGEEMHRAYAAGFAIIARQDTEIVNFTTVGDGNVESTCAGYQMGNPYSPDEVPPIPAHAGCRCWFEYAEQAVLAPV